MRLDRDALSNGWELSPLLIYRLYRAHLARKHIVILPVVWLQARLYIYTLSDFDFCVVMVLGQLSFLLFVPVEFVMGYLITHAEIQNLKKIINLKFEL